MLKDVNNSIVQVVQNTNVKLHSYILDEQNLSTVVGGYPIQRHL